MPRREPSSHANNWWCWRCLPDCLSWLLALRRDPLVEVSSCTRSSEGASTGDIDLMGRGYARDVHAPCPLDTTTEVVKLHLYLQSSKKILVLLKKTSVRYGIA
jgi:hypothetical protein